VDEVEKLNKANAVISNAEAVQRLVKLDHDVDVSILFTRKILRGQLGMRYRKIERVSLHANLEKNKILRQQWAEAFIKLWQESKVILNVDETWLGMSDFRRMKWRGQGVNNSVPSRTIAPRISMIVGLDSNGNVYYSLT
jgi:hypothetical protein